MFEAQIMVVDLDSGAMLELSRSMARRPLRKIAYAIRDEVRRSMKKGGEEVGPNYGIIQIPSPPGTPPNEQSGKLKRSIRVGKYGEDYYIGTDLPYGLVHEYGGRHHPPRPYLRPARKKYERLIQEAFNGVDSHDVAAGKVLRFFEGKRTL